jgi:hypothetical protein
MNYTAEAVTTTIHNLKVNFFPFGIQITLFIAQKLFLLPAKE